MLVPATFRELDDADDDDDNDTIQTYTITFEHIEFKVNLTFKYKFTI